MCLLKPVVVVLIAVPFHAIAQDEDFSDRLREANKDVMLLVPRLAGDERKQYLEVKGFTTRCSEVIGPYRSAVGAQRNITRDYDLDLKEHEESLQEEMKAPEDRYGRPNPRIADLRSIIANTTASRAEALEPTQAKVSERRRAWMKIRSQCYVNLRRWEVMMSRLRER